MDVNGTKFHLLLGKADWSVCTQEDGRTLAELWALPPERRDEADVYWNEERCELTLRPLLFRFPPAPDAKNLALELRRGAARDLYGNWYWIAEDGQGIRVNSAGTKQTSHFWSVADCQSPCAQAESAGEFRTQNPPPPLVPFDLCGLAVTEDHYLVVGVLEPAGLLLFDLHAGGAPEFLLWPEEIEFHPFDIAARPGGGVWILDRDRANSSKTARYWALDRRFNVIVCDQSETVFAEARDEDFQPVGSPQSRRLPRRSFPQGIRLEDASPIEDVDAIAIEALPDGTVLILDRQGDAGFSRVSRYRFGERLGDAVSTRAMIELIEEEKRADFQLIAHDFAFVPEHEAEGERIGDRLYFVAQDGNQAFAFGLVAENEQLKLNPLAEYFPMRLFGGKALVGAGDQAHYDLGETWIALVKQARPRFELTATLLTPLLASSAADRVRAFDGLEPDCVWHRLILDACLPPDTGLAVWSRAANEVSELQQAQWQAEPRLYLRSEGSELPFAPTAEGEGNGSWELLFQKASGRYLQVKIKLTGNGRATPRLRALRAYYPRFSYLEQYLPAVYREDEESASFVDRFLANLEGFYTTLEDKVAAVQMLFDPKSAPPDVLEWLAGWFDIVLDPAWTESKRRLFIEHAMTFFQYRGTMRGIEMALRLALEDCVTAALFTEEATSPRRETVRLIEKFRTRLTPGILFGDTSEVQAPSPLIAQTSRWTPDQGANELHRRYNDAIEFSAFTPFSIHNPGGSIADEWEPFAQTTLGFVPSSSTSERRQWQEYLAGQYATIAALNAKHASSWSSFAAIELPADMPTDADARQDWIAFTEKVTGAAGLHRRLWQNFLARRYQRIETLNATYQTHWPSFAVVSLVSELPDDRAPLVDWYQFESVVLSMHRAAHRFTVMLPIPKSEAIYSPEYQRRLGLAERIVNWEKPAHTIFDVKFFWAMFRIGFARLGKDTTLDAGSRAPQLVPPMILGSGYLAENFLAPRHPQDVSQRQVLGRDRLS